MILSDRSIRECIGSGEIVIDPLDESALQPSSVDLTLGSQFLVFTKHGRAYVDPWADDPQLHEEVTATAEEPFVLHPNEFVLAATREWLTLAPSLVGRLEGKSSLGRLGLLIHSTAGFVDAGWSGRLTLELLNVCTLPILLHPGMRIAQISFLRMTTAAERPYGSKGLQSRYQGQEGPTASRYNPGWDE